MRNFDQVMIFFLLSPFFLPFSQKHPFPSTDILSACVCYPGCWCRTGLVSNSWGDSYDRTLWDEAFDAVVISGEVGLRKPSMEIFELALSLIDLPAEDVVYVDDEYPNVLAAASYGFRAVHCDPNDPLRVQRVREAVI